MLLIYKKIADKIFEMIDQIMGKVGKENVVQIVTDNAANYKAARVMLMEKKKKNYTGHHVQHIALTSC